MEGLRQQLPSLTGLVAFEAAARHRSFTRAAQELGVSREAVSKQIRGLETELAVSLFNRVYRGLELTRQGEELYGLVQRGLMEIAEGVKRIRNQGQVCRFTISATHAIASYWLTAPLRKFRDRHPELEVQVLVSDELLDLRRENIDVSLRYGEGDWPDLDCTCLFRGESFPVCAPEYLRDAGPLNEPADLLQHTLLVLEGPYHGSENWRWWLSKAGVSDPDPSHVLHFNTYNVLIQSALEGQGVALGFGGVVDDLLGKRRLVRPLQQSFARGRSVYLVCPTTTADNPATRSFVSLVVEHASMQRQQHLGLTPALQTGL
jgi:DNA-binding transcriptional LysR family regulator